MSDVFKDFKFALIKVAGDLQSAKTADGVTVHRKDRIYFDGHGLVACASYDNHFVFDDPMSKKLIGRWSPMCTCGGPAVIVGYNAYAGDASPTGRHESTIPGEMVVCYLHAQTGHHADGSS